MPPAAAHLTYRSLHLGDEVEVWDVDCRSGAGPCGEEEAAERFNIVFPRAGVFRRHASCGETLADVNQALFFRPGEPYRVSHPAPGGDACTVLSFQEAPFLDATDGTLPVTSLLADAATHAKMRLLRTRSTSGAASPLETEERALLLLGDLAARAQRAAGRPVTARREATRRRRRELAEAAREILAARFREKLTLAGIAREIASSPFHLARLFRAETGLPVHRYLNRLRLREAIERIDAGAPDLSALACEVGFSSHAHFTDAFRREFGMPPSRARIPSGA